MPLSPKHGMIHMVMHEMNQKHEDGETAAITVRLPREQYLRLKEYATAQGASLNSLVAEAIVQYQTRIQREDTIRDIREFRKNLPTGDKSDAVDTLQRIREERSRKDRDEK